MGGGNDSGLGSGPAAATATTPVRRGDLTIPAVTPRYGYRDQFEYL